MKLDTRPSLDPEQEGSRAFVGFVTLTILAGLILLFKWLWHFHSFRLVVLTFPVIAIVSWFVGYTLERAGSYSHECVCKYAYRYFWTEWWHKTRCLAFQLNGRE